MVDDRLRRAAALVFVEDLATPRCSSEDEHHLRHALRLRDGEIVATSDGHGAWRLCRVVVPDRADRHRSDGALALEPASAVITDPPPPERAAVGFCLQKGDRADWTVQKLTELGVDEIIPLLSERTVVRLDDDDRRRRGDRLRRIAREAAGQSRRTRLPLVGDPVPLATALVELAARYPVALAEPGGGALDGARAVLVGPEGGWSAAELASAPRQVDLGRQVLRAETAAIVAGVLLTSVA
ncbi:MAG: RsmE family RNA methyltransferase [Actinomycetota bacterium]|nr:RsmE family RNA methyltransferase [Actinomycetota bacterium]